MARTFDTAVQTVLDSGLVKYFYFIKLEFTNDTYRFTSHGSNLTWESQTWNSDGGLFEVDSPNFSTVVDREAYKVIVTDFDDEFADEFKVGVIGKPIQVWIGFCNSSNQPLLGAGQVVPLYKGFVDSPSVNIDWDNKTAVIEGTSPMSDLDQTNTTMVSKNGMDNLSLTDTSYDSIFEDSETVIKWGKI